ncbi:hypothetical protein NL676_020267 [Syzygium grande]|nr:hypothetical protein NL676_020267 [Syzygium grande]
MGPCGADVARPGHPFLTPSFCLIQGSPAGSIVWLPMGTIGENYQCASDNEPDEEGPVLISVPFPLIDEKPQLVLVGETSKCPITMENTSSDEVELWGIRIFSSNPTDSFMLSLVEPPSLNSDDTYVRAFRQSSELEDRVLQPHQTLTIWLSCKPKDMGLQQAIVHFDVEDARIERVVFLLAEDKISQSLAPNRSYSRVPRRKQFNMENCEFAVPSRPAREKTRRSRSRVLPEYPIPKKFRELYMNNQVPDVLDEGLTTENYSAYFNALVIIEELYSEKEMRRHNMECVQMTRKGAHLLSLVVPGLAEKRPSLLQGDVVLVKLAYEVAPNTIPYKGHIQRVQADEVLLRFADEFHDRHLNKNSYSVQFACNRVNMRRLYQAIEAAERLGNEILFPTVSIGRRLIEEAPFVPFTSNLNEEQMHCIQMILGCRGAPPYVIFGPPGTGKTMTLVEAILQVYKTRRSSRVLICAASNSAADHILEKLITNEVAQVKESEIFRLNATSRPYHDLQAEHIRYCYFVESVFRCPPLEALMRYRIIISTYTSSSLLHTEGVESHHFSHIFLDEAGQASEPECMVPVANLCRKETVVVLAGDPKQLGPVIHSKDAEARGLGKSFLERLFEHEFYLNEDIGFVTKLVRNYRCHPAILDLPSKLFYEGQLLACKENSSSVISSSDLLPNKEFPVLFIGIQGCDEREGNNPSWFNRIEASKVVDFIQKLTDSSSISESNIGVITPYQQQVVKIKKVLETYDMSGVKVGSVEQFQGQEREVIIVSTVRSTLKHTEFDRAHCLGFLSNPRRFNVAVTRARSLLVIIGNPHIVSKDPHWEKLLQYCVDNNSYQGCPLPEGADDDDVDDEESFIGDKPKD